MQKIALISEHASPLGVIGGVDAGGQNIYVANVAKQLARLGVDVDVFTRCDNPHLPDVAHIGAGIRVIHVPAGPPSNVPKEALLPYMKAFSAFLIDWFRREPTPYDAMHANFFMSGDAALRVKARLGVPLVMTFHALGRVRRRHQGAADGFPDARFPIEDALARRADRLIAECPQDAADLRALYRADPGRIEIVPCGFDEEEFRPVLRRAARARLGWRDDEFAVLQLGRLVPRKGIDNVIEALARVPLDAGARPARLYVVGGSDYEPDPSRCAELARLAGIAREAGVADRVTFVGRRDRDALHLYYGAADVFVTTPWYEPFGITPVEAMACATPVIGSDVGGIRTTVEHGVTGYLVAPRDPGALAARLDELRRDPERAQQLGWAGYRRAHRHYTWRGVAERLAAIYRDVAACARRGARAGTAAHVRRSPVAPSATVANQKENGS
ncbi:glycosyl transferases group 1 family protein [Burkholderia pseudomallei MSHR4375]|uniref:glycosyltransferase family 4 protein n=1 Tax=Burkholderia pseudomallei TaxID=28450 RepID=UPI0005367280|nr:glycosyltransferase family 1 protein [Burkholderia pseudomallei]KGV80088.1 glycosyl transferases group 1 family protein [Burkholderia pseudomallei MSHR4375]